MPLFLYEKMGVNLHVGDVLAHRDEPNKAQYLVIEDTKVLYRTSIKTTREIADMVYNGELIVLYNALSDSSKILKALTSLKDTNDEN